MFATRALQALVLALYAPLAAAPRQKRAPILLGLGRGCTAMQRWLIDHFAYLAPIASARANEL